MTDKTASKYLINLEKYFANDNPILLKAARAFQELDQIEYDLGLIEMDETTASKSSWWSIVSLIGGNSSAKSKFINNYLSTPQTFSGIQTASHKFTVLSHSNQPNSTTLPGTALDVDHRYPFYQISQKLDRLAEGEGSRINSYLELKTINSDRLRSKLFIDAPNITAVSENPVTELLTTHVIENSDLILVFTDVFESSSTPMLEKLIELITLHQDTNKFVYLIEEPPVPAAIINPSKNSEIISTWQRKLAKLGLNTGQFIILPSAPTPTSFAEIELRMDNVKHDRCYRILQSMDKSILGIQNVIVPEVKKAMVIWKDRANMSSLIVLGFVVFLLILAEIQVGILDLLISPIVGPIALVVLLAFLTPLHLIMARLHARLITGQLLNRQKELMLMENLAGMFENNLTLWRILLPISEPAGWSKKTRSRLRQLSQLSKDLAQSLNDDFISYDDHN